MPSVNAFFPDTPLRGSLPFDAPPPQPTTSSSQRRAPSYDQLGQAMLRAYQNGNLAQINALYGGLQKGLANGSIVAPPGRLGAKPAQPSENQPLFFDPNEGQEPPAAPVQEPQPGFFVVGGEQGDAIPVAQPAEQPLFFDPNEGKQAAGAAQEPMFFDPNGGQDGAPEQDAHDPQFANPGMFGPGGAAIAGLESFADAATLGLAPKVEARLAAYMNGVPLSTAANPFTDDPRIAAANTLAEERGDQLAAAHPYASVTGALGGIVGGAVGMAPAIEKAGLGAVAGHGIRNVAKAAGLGAGMGYAESALHGGDTAENTLAAAAGGIGGPIAGKVAGTVTNRLGRVSNRAWRVLASKMEGVTPADLKAWFGANLSRGAKPNIAAMLDAHARGEVQGFASHNPAMRGALVDEARSAVATKGTAALEMRRTADMDRAMGRIRDKPTTLPQELVDNEDVMQAIRREAPSIRPIGSPKGTLSARDKIEALMNGKTPAQPLTVGEQDTIRQGLRDRASGNGENARLYKDISARLSSHLETTQPAYGKALGRMRAQSSEIAGLSHGLGGGTDANMPADLQRRISTPAARRGLAEGQQRHQNAKALAEVSGGIGKSPGDRGFENMVAGVAETAAGSHVFGLRNMARGFGGILRGEKLPRDMQLQLAKALATTDPHEFHAAVGRLERAGVSLEKIRALQSAFSAYVGGGAGSVFWPDEPLQ